MEIIKTIIPFVSVSPEVSINFPQKHTFTGKQEAKSCKKVSKLPKRRMF